MTNIIKSRGSLSRVLLLISAIRLIPHLILLNTHRNRYIIKYEVERWIKCLEFTGRIQSGFLFLMTFYPEFRNLFYYRIGWMSYLIRWLAPQMGTLYIQADEIGPGLFIQHGYATLIRAKKIGKDCHINQQVTIDSAIGENAPSIGDRVKVRAGAIVMGNVHLGDGSYIGVNAAVLNDIPERCTVFGIPARIIHVDKT